MEGLDLLNGTVFSRNYEWSQAICDPLENSDPAIAETEQTDRQNTTLLKKAKIMENCLSEKKRTINLAS